ncbi:MAG: protein translocase subunit SecDF, partial [Bacteroidota bacterium]
MRNKGAVIGLTIIVTLLCIYYLSFTFVARGVQQDAIAYATESTSGVIDLQKKQSYLDSVWTRPVYNLFGAEYTYEEVKETELSLGLDLQGGMHVTLEVSPVDIIKALSGQSEDPSFNEAIKIALEQRKNAQSRFGTLFYDAYSSLTDKPLSDIFATAANRGRITRDSSDDEVMEVINSEIDDAIDRSEIILRTRIDQFGTSQPDIQRLQGTGRIQIEIPGADNPERVRKLLQGVAKLEFWDVANPQDYTPSLIAINDLLVKEQQAEIQLNGSIENDGVAEEVTEPQEDLKSLLSSDSQDSTVSELDSALNVNDSTDTNLDSLINTQVSPLFSLSKAQGLPIYDVRDTAVISRILKRDDVKALIPRTIKPLWEVKPILNEETGEELLQLYFVKVGRGGNAQLTGEVITNARQDLDERTRPAVSMNMNALGSKIWKKMTAQAAATQGRIAIVLDNLVYSAPGVSGEIPNGSSQISGNFTLEEAKDLA